MDTLQPPDQTSARVIEAYCAFLDSPTQRLRFIRKAVARCQVEGVGTPSRWPLFDRFRLRKIILEELVPLLPDGSNVPPSIRAALWAYRLRVPIYAAGLCGALAVVLFVGFGVVRVVKSVAARSSTAAASTPSPETVAKAALPTGELPQYAPEQIWLVEQGQGYEVYSNGARILTDYETDGPPRRYYAFPLDSTEPDSGEERSGPPIGVVFHTSQSHIAPFKQEYNQKLQRSAEALLSFVQKHRLYHYVIDRFGRIYRVVRDDGTADHACNSVWADEKFAYLDLSTSFLGICFEAEWTPDLKIAPDQINEAQLYAGRVLTAVLRSKYGIHESCCVTHGLVSVSPASELIGFHTDWAKGFPFEALNLSDKYTVETPSIALFGFGHDGQFDRAIGTTWPGIGKAEARLDAEAASSGVTRKQLERSLRDRYRSYKSWLRKHDVEDAGEGG